MRTLGRAASKDYRVGANRYQVSCTAGGDDPCIEAASDLPDAVAVCYWLPHVGLHAQGQHGQSVNLKLRKQLVSPLHHSDRCKPLSTQAEGSCK